jgi:hypothetical protein
MIAFNLKISVNDRMRIEQIVLDRDSEKALALIKEWLETIDLTERLGMRSHLNG